MCDVLTANTLLFLLVPFFLTRHFSSRSSFSCLNVYPWKRPGCLNQQQISPVALGWKLLRESLIEVSFRKQAGGFPGVVDSLSRLAASRTGAHQSPLSMWFPRHTVFPRILKWVFIPFYGGSLPPQDWALFSCTAGRSFIIWASREALESACQYRRPGFDP